MDEIKKYISRKMIKKTKKKQQLKERGSNWI